MRYYWATIFGLWTGWLALWAVVLGYNAWRQSGATDFFLKASADSDQLGMQVGNQLSRDASDWIETALIYGVGWSIPTIVGLVVAGFVFKRIAKVA